MKSDQNRIVIREYFSFGNRSLGNRSLGKLCALAVLGSFVCLGHANAESGLAQLMHAGFLQQGDELSLQELFNEVDNDADDESADDESAGDESAGEGEDARKQSTDALLDLDDDETHESEDNDRQRDEAGKIAKSREKAVNKAMERLRKPLIEIRLDPIDGDKASPRNRAAGLLGNRESVLIVAAGAQPTRYHRRTMAFRHRPLYFEHRNLERCGNGHGYLQNQFSAFHFIGSFVALPCHMVKQNPHCPVCATSNCRCGESLPIDLHPRPVDVRATAAELAALAGFSFLLL